MPGFAADDTQEVSSPYSALNRPSNTLVTNSQPASSNAPTSLYNPVVSSGPVSNPSSGSNSLVASAIAAPAGISGSGSVDVMAGSGNNADYSPLSSSQQDALISKSSEIGANPSDLYGIINKETGGSFSPATKAPGNELGILGFTVDNQKKYGVKADQTFEEQLDAAAKYLKDRGWKPGMGLAHMTSIVYSGGLKKGTDEPRYNYRNKYGTTVRDYVKDVEKTWYPKPRTDTLEEPAGVPLPRPRPNLAPSNDLVTGLEQATAAKTAAATGLTSPRLIANIQPLTGGVDKSADILESPGVAVPLVPNNLVTPHVAAVESLSPGIADVVRLGGDLTPDNKAPLKYGDVSDELRPYQETLRDRGYYRGPIDNDFGKHTRTAVRSFQRDSGLPDTGVIDRETSLRLNELRRMTKEGPGLTPPTRPTEKQYTPTPRTTPSRVPTDPMSDPNMGGEVPVAGNPVEDALRAVVEGGKIATDGLPTREFNAEPPVAVNVPPYSGLNPPRYALSTEDAASAARMRDREIAAQAPTQVAKPVYSAPPGSIPASDRISPPTGPNKLDRKQEFDKMYEALPPGAIYVSPDGKTRRKGGKTSSAEGKTKVASADKKFTTNSAVMSAWNAAVDGFLEKSLIDPEQHDLMYNNPPEGWGKATIPRDDPRTMYSNGQRDIEPEQKYPDRINREPSTVREWGMASSDNPFGIEGNVDPHGLPYQAKPPTVLYPENDTKYSIYRNKESFKSWLDQRYGGTKYEMNEDEKERAWEQELNRTRALEHDLLDRNLQIPTSRRQTGRSYG